MADKMLVFDMDGTIADLYGVDNWLTDLRSYSSRPYENAKPMYNMDKLNEVLSTLKSMGWKVVVTSWLAKNSHPTYDNAVRKAKLDWLEKYKFPYDEIHLVKYGTTKANCTRHHGGYQILIDDNEKVRNGWRLGHTIDANKDIMADLKTLMGATA